MNESTRGSRLPSMKAIGPLSERNRRRPDRLYSPEPRQCPPVHRCGELRISMHRQGLVRDVRTCLPPECRSVCFRCPFPSRCEWKRCSIHFSQARGRPASRIVSGTPERPEAQVLREPRHVLPVSAEHSRWSTKHSAVERMERISDEVRGGIGRLDEHAVAERHDPVHRSKSSVSPEDKQRDENKNDYDCRSECSHAAYGPSIAMLSYQLWRMFSR